MPAEEPANFCLDHTHEGCCKDCVTNYVENTVTSAFLGTCPIISCPSAAHPVRSKKRRILLYEEWNKILPSEISKKYSELASSLLAFLCGGCHALKSLDVGFESSHSSGKSYQYIEKYLGEQDGGSKRMTDLLSVFVDYSAGLLTTEECYSALQTEYFSNLMTKSDTSAWELFYHLLRMICDPERRANLHLRYLRDRPRIKTLCCMREHCFRCKVKDYHEGRSCMESSTDLDHSIVNCPTCGIALAKGDGCNTITCVCGKQFSWTVEKENTDKCVHFLEAYPEKTSEHCASVLCTETSSRAAVFQQALAWQVRNRQEVARELLQWFRNKYFPCPSQTCVTIPLESVPEGVKQAVDIWKTHRPQEVSRCATQNLIAQKSLFTTMYPAESDRAWAAHELVNNALRNKKLDTLSYGAMMVRSASLWIADNKEAYTYGVEAAEVRMAKQFLYLYGKKQLHTTLPLHTTCPYSYEWCREISNPELTYSNFNSTVCRVGSVSCYPACFSKLVSDHALFRVSIDTAPRSSNWLTFGIAKRGMATSSSDGVGRTSNTWGVADDRSSLTLPVLSAGGTTVGNFRKLAANDVLTAEIDTVGGWCEIRLNDMECSHRFDIPPGTMDDYWFAMTFANDHQVTIQQADDTCSVSTVMKDAAAGTLNAEHTKLFQSFKKQLKLMLAEPSEPESRPTSSLQSPSQKWVETCGGIEAATNCYNAIETELSNFVKFGREYAWKEPSALEWLTWNDVLNAVSWYYDNKLELKEIHDSGVALSFSLTHGADAPFMAAIFLANYHSSSKVNTADTAVSLSFMKYFAEDMQEWYDYDYEQREPMIANVAKGCRCLPRHIKTCPMC
jgi:hypothetical protein